MASAQQGFMPASYNYSGIGSGSSTSTALTSASTVGGSPTQIQYNSGGGFAGINGSAVDASGNVSLTSSLQITPASGLTGLTVSGTAGGSNIPAIILREGAVGMLRGIQFQTAGGAVRGYIGIGADNFLNLNAQNSEATALRIDTSGNVGLGVTPTASTKLTVSGTAIYSSWTSIATSLAATTALEVNGTVSATAIQIGSSPLTISTSISNPNASLALNSGFDVRTNISNVTKLYLDTNGLSIGRGATGSSPNALSVSGTTQLAGAVSMTSNVRMSGLALSAGLDYLCMSTTTSETTYNTTTCTVSDRKYKQNIADAQGMLKVAMALQPRNYDWKPGLYPEAGRQIGFIAQEVQPVIPSLVGTGSNGDLSVDYAKMSAVAIGAIQEMQAEIDELRQHAGLPPKYVGFGARVKWLLTGE